MAPVHAVGVAQPLSTGQDVEFPYVDGFCGDKFGSRPPVAMSKEFSKTAISMLTSADFSDASLKERIYINLVVLFRTLLYYADLSGTSSFWQTVQEDWITKPNWPPAGANVLAGYYVKARLRYRELTESQHHEDLLTRLVDFYIQNKSCKSTPHDVSAVWSQRRAEWKYIRSNQLHVLLHHRVPPCLPWEWPNIDVGAVPRQPVVRTSVDGRAIKCEEDAKGVSSSSSSSSLPQTGSCIASQNSALTVYVCITRGIDSSLMSLATATAESTSHANSSNSPTVKRSTDSDSDAPTIKRRRMSPMANEAVVKLDVDLKGNASETLASKIPLLSAAEERQQWNELQGALDTAAARVSRLQEHAHARHQREDESKKKKKATRKVHFEVDDEQGHPGSEAVLRDMWERIERLEQKGSSSE